MQTDNTVFSCEDIDPSIFSSRHNSQYPRRVLLRLFDKWFHIIISIIVIGILMITYLYVATTTNNTIKIQTNLAIILYIVSLLIYVTFSHNNYDKKKEILFYSLFNQKHTKLHVLIAIVLTGIVHFSLGIISNTINWWFWLFYIFPLLLISSSGSTKSYIYFLVFSLLILSFIQSATFIISFNLPFSREHFFLIILEMSLIVILTGIAHQSNRQKYSWVNRNRLLQQVIIEIANPNTIENSMNANNTEQWIVDRVGRILGFEKVFILGPNNKDNKFHI